MLRWHHISRPLRNGRARRKGGTTEVGRAARAAHPIGVGLAVGGDAEAEVGVAATSSAHSPIPLLGTQGSRLRAAGPEGGREDTWQQYPPCSAPAPATAATVRVIARRA